ncbi:MAG TPA: nucleotide exchange factor GrpE [Pyrinomonadaceae bacterium]|nr:nucleotide exchange factor GrpE [Acidobacteriota bacterium]HQZ95465.1 nucleotide exchange factor GrpE [Pyrinomonadaceae bacterium]
MPNESLDELDMDAFASVDDFIKELEAKEKDLHITSDLKIEISESEYDPRAVPDFLPQEIAQERMQSQGESPGGFQQPGLKTRVFELENEIDTLNRRISELRAERNDVQEKSDRRLKDFENYKYRMDRERRGAFIDQISNLAQQMLPVLDNLDRAMGALDRSQAEKSAEFQQFYDGIALVHQQVNEVFSEMGVQPIATVGEPFDPNFHEAVATEERSDIPGNTVSGELLRGYRIGNRVIRHSMVKVTLGPQPVKFASPEDAGPAPEGEIVLLSSPENELPDLDPPYNNEDENSHPAE